MGKPVCTFKALTIFWQCTLAQDAIHVRWSRCTKMVRCHLMHAL